MINALNDELEKHRISNKMGQIKTVEQLDRELGLVKQEKGLIPKTKKGGKNYGGGKSSSKGKGKGKQVN
ncbi:hypothetical protein CASFOL_025755 [Castilleja foliolosa]|uniref:Uncharacterized protein n=1 Tax=Castilleja foliolosa TaxID=1961234 RepID=A0ABD3CVA3_9LAMI